jgi:hypothetical protein
MQLQAEPRTLPNPHRLILCLNCSAIALRKLRFSLIPLGEQIGLTYVELLKVRVVLGCNIVRDTGYFE